MNIGFYTAVSGMQAYQRDMDVIAHNMANISTIGYKPSVSSFQDLLYTQLDTNVEGDFALGHGVKVHSTDLIMNQSGLNRTDILTDFAIVGQGFFQIDRGGAATEYTKNGAFTIGMNGEVPYLVTTDGGYVLDQDGERIELPYVEDSNIPDIEKIEERIGTFTFTNPYGLNQIAGSSFLPTTTSGEPVATKEGLDLVQGALEFSGSEISNEMVKVMQTQKAFQLNAKMVQTADQIEEMVNSLR